MPEAWILALVRPTQFCAGRESSGNAGFEQIWAGEGTFSTLAMLPGSSRIWPWPTLGSGQVWTRTDSESWVHCKMVLGHNLHYIAPFAIPRTGFCMVFQRASFVVHARGQIWEPGIRLLDLGQRVGPETFLGSKMGPENSGFATESFCHGSSRDFP